MSILANSSCQMCHLLQNRWSSVQMVRMIPYFYFCCQFTFCFIELSSLCSHTDIGAIAFHKTKLSSFQAASKVFNNTLYNFPFCLTSDDSLKSSGWGKGKFRLTFFTESILGISSGCQASEGGFDLKRNPLLLPCAHSGLNYGVQHLFRL